MSEQVLRMKYHPAKQEVEFKRFAAGKPVVIRSDSKLREYMNKKFVLQNHGNSFFEDIADSFDGEKSVQIEVETTRSDYEDFMQMIEYYHKSGSIKITATLLAELPDMEYAYRAVREHGEKSVGILQKHILEFSKIPLDTPSVKNAVDMFSADVQKEINRIVNQIESMRDNSVNLCFTGVYSSGKSALINAILGYKILPEAPTSKTAIMLKIQSPKDGEAVRILFSIGHDYAELIWSGKNKTFEFGTAPTENNTRKKIQEALNSHKAEEQHRQLYEVLTTLNELALDKKIDTNITLFFKIPLDNAQVQFTIYDTPGTGSNHDEHQQVLRDALSEQTHSILIFVASPDKLEGEGNSILLSFLQDAEKEDSKAHIDIGRSLFVINKAETIFPDDRMSLQTEKITRKDDSSFSIKLSDKKLFFTSAIVAYAAKAKANGIAGKTEEFTIKQQSGTINDNEFGCYYRQNRAGTSEYGTQRLHKLCDEALDAAENKNDTLKILHICSGMFALESEIITYGEKYAAAVRASAIIDSVGEALSAMNMKVQTLEGRGQDAINEIHKEIDELRRIITESIKTACDKHEYPKGKPLPPDVLKNLKLDGSYVQSNTTGNILSFCIKKLKGWFFGHGRVLVDENHKKEITQKVTSVLEDFTNEFLLKRQRFLEQKRDNFIADVKKIIHENGRINDKAKSFVLAIRPPEIKTRNSTGLSDIYDSKRRADKFLGVDISYVDKDAFIKAADEKLTQMTTSMANDFMNDLRDTLTNVLSSIVGEFTHNIDKYSLLMRAKVEDKKAMEQLCEKIAEAVRDLSDCKKELDGVIWSVKTNG